MRRESPTRLATIHHLKAARQREHNVAASATRTGHDARVRLSDADGCVVTETYTHAGRAQEALRKRRRVQNRGPD
eukprot:scaffold43322_cov28-Tisochrysis_lutea.AAC.13